MLPIDVRHVQHFRACHLVSVTTNRSRDQLPKVQSVFFLLAQSLPPHKPEDLRLLFTELRTIREFFSLTSCNDYCWEHFYSIL